MHAVLKICGTNHMLRMSLLARPGRPAAAAAASWGRLHIRQAAGTAAPGTSSFQFIAYIMLSQVMMRWKVSTRRAARSVTTPYHYVRREDSRWR
jgi:hypothetical protein